MWVGWGLRGAVIQSQGRSVDGPFLPVVILEASLHPSGRNRALAQWPAQASGPASAPPWPGALVLGWTSTSRSSGLVAAGRQRGAPDPPLLPSSRPLVPPLPLPPPLPFPLQPLPPPRPGPSPSLPSPTRDPGRCCWAGPPGLSPAPRRAAAASPFAEEEAPGRGAGRRA